MAGKKDFTFKLIDREINPMQILVALIFLFGVLGVFLFFLLRPQREKVYVPVFEEDAQQSTTSQGSTNQAAPTAAKVCFNDAIFWNWTGGGKSGKAQLHISPGNDSAAGSFLDADGKKTQYTFSLEEDGRASFRVPGIEDILLNIYGTGGMSCDTITLKVSGACTKGCTPPNSIPPARGESVDLGALGIPSSFTITQ